MNTIAPAIKRRRIQLGYTQRDMSEKIHLSEKAWQNIENGITKLDLERLQQIAEVLEMSLVDLINAQESFYVHQVNDKPNVGFSAKEVIIHNDVSESERKMFDKLIAEKDEQMRLLRNEVADLKLQLNELITKLVGKL
jgi:transcriptional regulator with XRE-family HTH domain